MTGLRPAWARARQVLDRRAVVVMAALAAIGIAIHQAWWRAQPLAAGDWHWIDRGRLLQWFPWPTVWDPSQGISGQNRFLDAFRFPIYAVSGLIGAIGGTWTLAEKLVYFLPFAVLLPIAGWLFAREVIGRSRWALLAPVILMSNSYLLLEGDVHTPLPLAEAVGLLTLVAFMRAMRRRSLGYSVGTGLLLSLCAICDIRAAYLTGVLMAGYLLVLTIVDRGGRRWLRRIGLAVAAAVVFLLSQAFWWVPLLAYGSVPHLPTPQAPNFNVITLEHGLAGVSAFWTGGRPANLVEAPLNPMFMVIPLLAMLPLLARRLSPTVVWLALAVVIAAFMAKTDTPPIGGLYDWMYLHIPGWRLFREGSKFLYIVVAGYSVLVPLALRRLFENGLRFPRRASALRGVAVVGLLSVLAIAASSLTTLETGALDTTTTPTPEPASFNALSRLMSADPATSAVLWFGSPLVSDNDGRSHRFIIASAQHGVENLTGSLSETQVNHLDPLQSFCADPLQPYCYLDPRMFPYLARTTGAGYIVAPGGENVGALPTGITRTWLAGALTAIYGAPTVLGNGSLALDVWRLPAPAAAVTAAPAVAVVDSGPWSLAQTVPALEALSLPAAYTESVDTASYPPSSADLPSSVPVMPRLNGGCTGTGGPVAVFAQSTAATLAASVGGSSTTLALLTTASRAPGWGAYGPVDLPSGPTAIASADAQLGPCIGWSPLAASSLTSGSSAVTAPPTFSSQGEQISEPVSSSPAWVELRRAYDPGWRLDGTRPSGVADGLFNLYRVGTAPHAAALPKGKAVFQFSTSRWERVGQALAIVSTIGFAAFLVWSRRRRGRMAPAEAAADPLDGFEMPSRLAPYIAGVGMALLAVSAVAVTIAWFGVPSQLTRVALSNDPYGLGIGYAAAALAVMGLAIVVRFAETLLPTRRRTAPAGAASARTASAVTAGTLVLGVLLTGCSIGGTDPTTALQQGQAAGAASPSVAAASLDDARLRGAAQQPELCIADYTNALTAYSNLASVYSGRANCYLALGRGAQAAVHDLDAALSLNPNSPSLYLARAVARRAAGDPDGARADYLVAATIPSASDGPFLQGVDGLISVNRVSDAQAAVTAGRARFPSSPLLHLAAADVDVALGRDLDARAELVTATTLAVADQDKVRSFSSLCHFDVLRLAYQDAIGECTAAVNVNANGAGAYDDRSVAELALGNPSAAIADLGRAIGAFDGNVGPSAQASGIDGFGIALLLEARARANVENGAFAAAAADFRQALASLPPGTPDFAARLKDELGSLPRTLA